MSTIEMTHVHVTGEAKGYRDVWWCWSVNEPVIVANDGCGHCGKERLNADPQHQFLCHIQKGGAPEEELLILAKVVRATDEAEAEIKVLRDAIAHMAQKVHQAYHGAHPPDLCDVTWDQCPRGLCRDAQYLLDQNRKRGMR